MSALSRFKFKLSPVGGQVGPGRVLAGHVQIRGALENNLPVQKRVHFGRISSNLIKVTLVYLLAPGDILRYKKDTGLVHFKHHTVTHCVICIYLGSQQMFAMWTNILCNWDKYIWTKNWKRETNIKASLPIFHLSPFLFFILDQFISLYSTNIFAICTNMFCN